MRAEFLASGFILGLVSVALAMPVGPRLTSSTPVKVHGCHHAYGHDPSGWHRHDKDCRTLRGVVGRKSRNSAKS